MKCKCVRCGIIIDVKGINPQNQKCKVCKDFLNSLYGKTAMNGFQEIQELKQQLAESEKKNEYFADRVEKYNKLVEKYNNLKEEVDSNFVDGQKYNELREQKDKEIQKLKQQLAENQKKKEDFKTMYFNKCLDYEHLREKFDDKCTEFELKEYD